MRAAALVALGASALLTVLAAAFVPGTDPVSAMIALLGCVLLVPLVALARAPDPPSRAHAAAIERVLALEAEGARVYKEHAGALAPALAAQREHDELLDGLAHELKTPLNSIRGFADVLLDEIEGPLGPEAREEVVLIRDAGEYLHSLIDEVLDVAGGRASEPEAMAPLELAPIVREVARMLEPRASEKGLVLRTELGVGVPLPRADGRRVRQIVTNLASNAVKYTERGQVTIALERRGDEVWVRVDDTGPGIAAADRERIFTAWERAVDARGPEGHGLGLAISEELATAMGARLELSSQVGKGSSFALVFPPESLS